MSSSNVEEETFQILSNDSSNWTTLFQRDAMFLFISAVAVVIISSFRSLEIDQMFRKHRELEELLPYRSIEGKVAIMIPIVGSISLIVFFYFFNVVALFVMGSVCIYAVTGMILLGYPIFERFFNSSITTEFKLPYFGNVALVYLILVPISIILTILWMITGHWTLNNLIGVTICVMSISFMQLPSIRVASIVLIGLFFYDIFWVFYSAVFFQENVMVAVATKQASNPVHYVAKSLNISTQSIAPTLHLPMKLMWGAFMLGLGDMVVPGLLVSFALRFDNLKRNSLFGGYFLVSVVGYAVGLFCAMIGAFVYNVAQPALLYLVPTTLIPVILLGYKRSELGELWNGTGLILDESKDVE